MTRWLTSLLLLLILLVAAALRLTGLDWDSYNHYHPDERFITWVATTIEWPANWSTALDPTKSTFNPFYWPPDAASQGIVVEQDQPRRFAYGHLPLYLGVLAVRLVERVAPLLAPLLPGHWLLTRDVLNAAGAIEFEHLTIVARALTGLVDVGTVALLFLLGRHLFGTVAGLLAAAFLSLNVMHIQLAHFFTFDPYLTFFTVAAVFFMALAVPSMPSGAAATIKHSSPEGSGYRPFAIHYLLLAAVCVGLAVGSKFSSILLLLPLALTAWLDRARPLAARVRYFLLASVVAFLTFAVTNPFAILAFNCEAMTPATRIAFIQLPEINWRSCYLENVGAQGTMVRGQRDVAFVRQYAGTLPYLYFVEMQLRWGMGPFLGLVAFAGMAWETVRLWSSSRRPVVRADWRNALLVIRQDSAARWIVLFWTLFFFMLTGGLYVKFMRYLQPITPFLMLYGAVLLLSLPRGIWRILAIALVLSTITLYALSFVNLYRQPHPWMTASRWIYTNVEPGSVILGEQWDDSLPFNLVVDGRYQPRNQYHTEELTWLTGIGQQDNEVKLAHNLALLAEADYVALASNRIYGVVPRLPDPYPISSQFHPLLFDGRLGYEVVYTTGRMPELAGFHLKPDTFGWPGLAPPSLVAVYLDSLAGINWGRVDESFVVYDQPLVIIFENKERLTAAEMARLFAIE